MRGAVYVNGKIAPADQAVVPVYDHGFVYGEGVYETLRTYNAHLSRDDQRRWDVPVR